MLRAPFFLFALAGLALAACGPSAPPDRYVIQGSFENAGVSFKVNGFPVYQEERETAFETAQQINAFLKPGINEVEVALRPANPARRPRLGLIIGRLPAAGGEAGPEVLFRLSEEEAARLPYARVITIEAPEFPDMLLWKAESVTPDAAARAAIAADLQRLRDAFAAGLQARNAEQITAVMMALPAIADLGVATNPETVEQIRKGMSETLIDALADTAAAGSTVSAPGPDDLVLEPITTAHLRVRRKDGGPVGGVAFVGADGRTAGLFIDRPIYGRIGGQWQLLRN